MAREGLGFEEVVAAAKKIEGRGERVTLRSVRAELGTGSLTTISRHLDEYQGGKKRETAAKVDAALQLPAKIIEAIQGEIEAAKTAAVEELKAEIEQLKADRDSLVAEVERLSSALDEAREECALHRGGEKALKEIVESEKRLREMAERERNEFSSQLKHESLNLKLSMEARAMLKQELDKAGEALNAEREARHKAELKATEQAGLAQRMQDKAVEALDALDKAKKPAQRSAAKQKQ